MIISALLIFALSQQLLAQQPSMSRRARCHSEDARGSAKSPASL